MLWWVVGEYSTVLSTRVTELDDYEYALIAGYEAATRTTVLPPPHSVGALIARALKPCRTQGSTVTYLLRDFLTAANGDWRKRIAESTNLFGASSIVPTITALAKTEEFGAVDSIDRVLPNICPGLKMEALITPTDMAQQFYTELVFLKAMGNVEG